MKSKLFLTLGAVIVLLGAVATAQSDATVMIYGHSETRTQYSYIVRNPQSFSEFALNNIYARNFDSRPCSILLFNATYVYKFMPVQPTFSILWVGDVDAEEGIDPTTFSTCLQQLVTYTFQSFPDTIIVLPNVPADAQAVQNPANYLSLVAAYNQSMQSLAANYPCGTVPQACIVPVDVHSYTTLPSGYGNPNLTYIDFYDPGWLFVMLEFRSKMYPMLSQLPAGH